MQEAIKKRTKEDHQTLQKEREKSPQFKVCVSNMLSCLWQGKRRFLLLMYVLLLAGMSYSKALSYCQTIDSLWATWYLSSAVIYSMCRILEGYRSLLNNFHTTSFIKMWRDGGQRSSQICRKCLYLKTSRRMWSEMSTEILMNWVRCSLPRK